MINALKLDSFRNYPEAVLAFENHPFVVFIGENGAGKTNLLESIFFMGLLRSFRTGKLPELIRSGSRYARIAIQLQKGRLLEQLEVRFAASGERELFRSNCPVPRASEFIRSFYPVAFTPDDILLIQGSASPRRRFMDMFFSMKESSYLTALHAYFLALRQRNAALKHYRKHVDMLLPFEQILAENAIRIASVRRRLTAGLEQEIRFLLASGPWSDGAFSLEYTPSFPESEQAYMERFESERDRELRRGNTLFGPQLDDYCFSFRNQTMRSYASNGQCRLVALLLKLAAARILHRENASGSCPVIALVDDVTGELDATNREYFFSLLANLDQTFFTFTGNPKENIFQDSCRFYIENGKIASMQ